MTNITSRPSLSQLAAEAAAAQETGQFHANYAIEGETINISALQKAAMAGDQRAVDGLKYLQESRDETFTNAFARSAFFRARIGLLRNQERPDPDMVLSTMFSAQGTNMWVRGQKEPQPAIPLFRSHKDRREAQKFLGRDIFPVRVSDSDRKNAGTKDEVMFGSSFKFLAPATAADAEAYEDLRQLLAKMPEVLALEFEDRTNLDVRHAVWLTLNLVGGARVFHSDRVKQFFTPKEDGSLADERGGTFVGGMLTRREVLVLQDDPAGIARRIVARLAVFGGVTLQLVGPSTKKVEEPSTQVDPAPTATASDTPPPAAPEESESTGGALGALRGFFGGNKG